MGNLDERTRSTASGHGSLSLCACLHLGYNRVVESGRPEVKRYAELDNFVLGEWGRRENRRSEDAARPKAAIPILRTTC